MKAKSIRKKLYHYCSIETFNIILKKKCLRLSDLSKTNDYTERKWSKSLVEEVLIEFFKANNISIDLREDYFYTDGVYNHI